MKTMKDMLDTRNGISTGFDFLRVFLALSIVFVHAFGLPYGKQGALPHNLALLSIVPMFFALSGFLITGSAMRLKLRDFILNRSFRIVPALAVDIFLGAILMGGLFTTLPIADYYRSTGFFSYFFNIFGLIHFHLPGVFERNPYPDIVNGNLWTIPFEIGCYVLISMLIWFRMLHQRLLVLAVTLGIGALTFLSYEMPFQLVAALGFPVGIEHGIDKVFENYFFEPWRSLYIYFLMGCLFYLYHDKIAYSWGLFAAALVIFFAGACLLPTPDWRVSLLYSPVVVYIMAFIGVSDLPKLPLFSRGDYSYGMYLYGFPIQQAIVASALPHIVPLWIFMPLSMVITIAVAMLSWHYVEKPVLRLRRNFSFTARKGDAH